MEPRERHAGRGTHRRDGGGRVGNAERAEFRAKHATGLKRFQFLGFAVAFIALTNVDVSGNRRVLGAERFADPCAEMRRGDAHGGFIAGMPVVLMARVQNRAQVGRHVRAQQRAAIHYARDRFQALREVNAVDGRWDRGERASDILGFHARRERRVPFGVEHLHMRHAAAHPEDNDGVGLGRAALAVDFLSGQRMPGAWAARAESVAAEAVFKKSRRIMACLRRQLREISARLFKGQTCRCGDHSIS